MGYDITAYVPKSAPVDPLSVAPSSELEHQLSFLEMGSRASDAHALFEALVAVEYDGVVSGIGIGRYFSRLEMQTALQTLCREYDQKRVTARVIRFVAEVVQNLAERDWVYIDFG